MARPTDWAPLADTDPVPGDPEGIRREVTHMKRIAQKLRTQAKAMQAIAECDGLKGKYADELGDKARGLGRRLDLAEDRYREVKGHLDGWADDMETAQGRADRALDSAKDAQRIIDRHRPEGSGRGGGQESGTGGTDDDDPVVRRAREDLEEARTRLNSAVTFYSERADHYADRIRSSIDDDLEDSWWNEVKAWVGDAAWLSELADVLSNVTSILTIAAIFFPALGVLAAILTAVIVGIHLLMALTGNGSWFDVVTDIAAFKMAKNGIKAAKAIQGLQKEGRSVAKGIAEREAKQQARRNRVADGRTGGGRLGRLRRTADNQQGRAAGVRTRDEALPQVTWMEKVRALGNKRMAEQVKDIKRMGGRYPEDPRLGEIASEAARQKGISQAYWGTSAALDAGGRLGDMLSSDYVNAKGNMTAPGAGVGSQW
ncbi:putative T7SS-secreted protein [Streptomyces sp. NPDC091292]|uniref:putative T7SS-secreted protein n=1 Tax=Streptomyces sp. NPDC091292 TaxID=3365991 RepID=UPI00380B8CA0